MEKTKPLLSFREGGIQVAAWLQGNTKIGQYYSIRLTKSWKSPGADWKKSSMTFFGKDLKRVISVLISLDKELTTSTKKEVNKPE